MTTRKQIGNLLVEAGIISPTTLERSLAIQKGSGKRLGALLRDMGIVTEEEVMEALARQCRLRTVRNFAAVNFPRQLLDLVPASLALEKLIFPLKQQQGMLAIATLDPFDRETFDQLAVSTGMQIHLALATKGDIVDAIRKHYPVRKCAPEGKQKILLIDPSTIVAAFLPPSLEREGYEVVVSHDGVDGLKLAYTLHPDLVICDLMMPRMDAYMFMYALKTHQETVHTPVILMSQKESPEEKHRAFKAGFADFIAKPAMPVRVVGSVRKALKRSGDTATPTASAPRQRSGPRQPLRPVRKEMNAATLPVSREGSDDLLSRAS